MSFRRRQRGCLWHGAASHSVLALPMLAASRIWAGTAPAERLESPRTLAVDAEGQMLIGIERGKAAQVHGRYARGPAGSLDGYAS